MCYYKRRLLDFFVYKSCRYVDAVLKNIPSVLPDGIICYFLYTALTMAFAVSFGVPPTSTMTSDAARYRGILSR